MDIQDLTTSRYGVAFAIALARSLRPPVGYRVALRLADWMASFRHSRLVRAIRLNQWVIHNKALDGDALNLAAREVLRHAARCQYDLLRHVHDSTALLRLIRMDVEVERLIAASRRDEAGCVVVGSHLSNFDLAIKAVGVAGVKAQILAIATPTSGYVWQNRLRSAPGVEITPINLRALAAAVERLRRGGIVVTGVDRPVPGRKEHLTFFDEDAALPTGHVRIAMDAGVPVRVVSTRMEGNGVYRISVSDPIPMRVGGNRKSEIRENAQRVLAVVEAHIRERPLQWLMFYPVWPHLMEQVPR